MKQTTRKYCPWLIVSVVLYAASAAVNVYSALVLGYIIDDATGLNMGALLRHTGLMLLLDLGSLFFLWVGIYARRMFVMRCVSDLKQRLMTSFYRRGIAAFRKESDSYYMNLLSNDMDLIENDYLAKLTVLAYYIAALVFSVVTLLYLSWKATLLFVLLFLLPIVVPQLLSGILSRRKAQMSKENEAFTFTLKEQVQGMADIVTNLSVSGFLSRFLDSNKRQQKTKMQAGSFELFLSQVGQTCGGVAQTACMGIGAAMVIQGQFTLGVMLAIVQLLNTVFQPINFISQTLPVMKASKPIRQKVDAELAVALPPEGNARIEGPMDIAYENVSISYGDGEDVIHNLTHTFPAGQTCAVIGDSGSGKTTIFKCLLKIHEQYTGAIQMGGQDLKDLTGDDVYRYVGYVPQNVYLFNDTIENNITMGGSYSQAEIAAVLEKVHLTELAAAQEGPLGDSGSNISGGEKQRIALARALLRCPQVLVFDEPTSALDPVTRDAINDLIFSLDGYTRIVITHDRRPEYLERFADTLAIRDREEVSV